MEESTVKIGLARTSANNTGVRRSGYIFTKARRHERRRKSKLCIRLNVGWYSVVVQIHQTQVYIFMYYALVPFAQA
jgi:hypothetical protein